jgi:hypothetical protein
VFAVNERERDRYGIEHKSLLPFMLQPMIDHRTAFPHHADVAKHMALCRGRPMWYLLCRSDAFQSFVQQVWLDSLFPVVRASMASMDGAVGDISVPTPFNNEALSVAGAPCAPTSGSMITTAISGSTSRRPPSPTSRRAVATTNYAQDPRDLSTQREASLVSPSVASMIASSHSLPTSSRHDIPTALNNGRRETLLKGFRALVELHEQRCSNTTLTGGTPPSLTAARSDHTAATTLRNDHRHAPPARVGAARPFVQDPNYGKDSTGGGTLSTAMATLFRNQQPTVVGGVSGTTMSGGGSSRSVHPTAPRPRIASATILRHEVALSRQQQQHQHQHQMDDDSSSDAAPMPPSSDDQRDDQQHHSPNGWMLETPMLTRYRLWIATSRTRSQVDRITELLAAIASAMSHQGPLDTMQRLLETVVQHPVDTYRHAAEQEETSHLVKIGAAATNGRSDGVVAPDRLPVEEVKEETRAGDDHGGEEVAAAALKHAHAEHHVEDVGVDQDTHRGGASDGWCRRTHEAFYLGSQTALLELRTFGYLPPMPSSTPQGKYDDPIRFDDHRSLLSNPADLLRSRLDMRKRAPLDAATQIELFLRHADIKQSLSLWWHWLPKHALRRAGGPDAHSVGGGGGDGRAVQSPPQNEAISRNVFVQIAIHIHCALSGGSLPLASPSTLAALRQLFYDDWPYLFTSYQQLQRVTHDDVSTPVKPGSGAGAVGISSQFRGLLAKGMECPLSFSRSLFDVAMLLLIEPWMETTSPEERLLALSMLFQKSFEKKRVKLSSDVGSATSDTDDDTTYTQGRFPGPSWCYRLRPLPAFTTNDNGSSGDGNATVRRPASSLVRPGSGSTTTSPHRALRPSSPGLQKAPVRELVEQLDAALDKNLVMKQARRNQTELSDVSVELTKDAWRSEVLRLNLRKARSRGTTFTLPPTAPPSSVTEGGGGGDATCTAPFDELELKKTFAPHDPSRSYGLERVLLQRLTRRVADCSAAALVLHQQQDFDVKRVQSTTHHDDVLQIPKPVSACHRPTSASGGAIAPPLDDAATLKNAVRATEQANIVVHATKHLIPPEYLHQIARYHRAAVEAFRDQVRSAAIALHHSGSGGVSEGAHPDDDDDATMLGGGDSDATLFMDIRTLADLLAPPPRRGFEKPLAAAQAVMARPHDVMEEKLSRSSACYVRRPASAQGHQEQHPYTSEGGRDGDDARLLDGVSESLRRPLSALLGRTAPHGLRDTRPRHLATHPRPTSSRPPSAARGAPHQQQPAAVPTTLYISPYMKVGALPVSGGSAFAAKRPRRTERQR